jgi:hypothetical protein
MELSSSLTGIVNPVQDKEVKRFLKIGKVLVTLDTSESAFRIEETCGAPSKPAAAGRLLSNALPGPQVVFPATEKE